MLRVIGCASLDGSRYSRPPKNPPEPRLRRLRILRRENAHLRQPSSFALAGLRGEVDVKGKVDCRSSWISGAQPLMDPQSLNVSSSHHTSSGTVGSFAKDPEAVPTRKTTGWMPCLRPNGREPSRT